MQLEERVFSIKKRFLAMYKMAHAGHIGSSLSCAELLVFLKYAWMREEDTFVLSKGHAVAALYALLAEDNAIDPRDLDSFYGEGTHFPALPPVNTLKEIPFATGSLGHGLSLTAGMALGARLNESDRRFFCLTSDGELDEGSTWEAALFIAHHKLTNLVWLVDRNRIQGIGGTEEVMTLEPLDAKLEAFGFHVVIADGHDFTSLLGARDVCTRVLGSNKGSNKGSNDRSDRWPSSPTRSRGTAFGTCRTRWPPITCRWTTRSTSKRSTRCRGRMRLPWPGPAMRDEFAATMVALFHQRRDLVFITGDVGYMAVEGIAATYGKRFINAGIAEQNMVSLAAGLAREGHLPWVYTMATFVALRPYEQIRTDVCLHKLPVKLVGNGGGYGYGIMGATHHALEDVGAMRVLPHMRLYLPLTAADVPEVVNLMAQDPLPNYLRLNAPAKLPGEVPRFAPWRKLKPGGKCIVIGMGPVLGNLYEMGDQRLLDDLEIWNVGKLPLEEIPAELIASIKEKQRVVIMEEHYGACGLAEALSYSLITEGVCPRSFISLAAKGYPSGRYGSQRWHQEENELAGRGLRARLESAVRD